MTTCETKRLCTYCNESKTFQLTDLRLRDGSKVYVDSSGRRWSGKRCPDCERERVKLSLRCDPFEKAHMIKELRNQGYTVVDEKLPLRVKGRDEKILTVGIRRAITENGKIVVEQEISPTYDIYILLFESIRVVERPALEGMKNRLVVANHENLAP